MSLTIVVNGGGTFTASMEEGPVSFTASLAAVGPAGPAGAAGAGVAVGGTTGQVLAKASGINYDTEWVARNPFDQELNTTDSPSFVDLTLGSAESYAFKWISSGAEGGLYYDNFPIVTINGLGLQLLQSGMSVTFPDSTTQISAAVFYDQSLNTTDGVNFDSVTTSLDVDVGGDLELTGIGSGINFSDGTNQTTALPNGLDDGYIVAWNADTSNYDSVPNDARTLFITARNITGTTIPKGSVVLITGASGNRPTIGLAQADTGAGADGVIGITAAAINNNANGRVITEGLASNLNTSAFAAGDKLYLSATTPGGLVNVRPVQPAHSVAVGIVTRSNPAVGSIEVRVQVGEHLEFLHDVLLTSRANGDFLVYESATSLWKNRTLASLDLLTATAAAAVYQPLSGMGSYLTTSAAASTYLTQSNAATTYAPIVHTHTASAVTDFDTAADARVNALVPAASTTAAGKVELATDAEAVAGTSSTLAVTPSRVRSMLTASNHIRIIQSSLSTANTGTISSVIGGFYTTRVRPGTAGACSSRQRIFGSSQSDQLLYSEYSSLTGYNFDNPRLISGRFAVALVNDANFRAGVAHGKAEADAVGDLARKGVAWYFTGGSGSRYVMLQVHNGTTLTDVTSTHEVTASTVFDWEIESDGTGNVTLYVNGASVATSSGGPTGTSASTTPAPFQQETIASGALASGFNDTYFTRGNLYIKGF